MKLDFNEHQLSIIYYALYRFMVISYDMAIHYGAGPEMNDEKAKLKFKAHTDDARDTEEILTRIKKALSK